MKIYGRSEEEDMEWREKEDAEVSPVGFERRRWSGFHFQMIDRESVEGRQQTANDHWCKAIVWGHVVAADHTWHMFVAWTIWVVFCVV